MTNYLIEREQFFKGKEEPRISSVTNVKVKRLHPDAVIPKKAHTGDAGFDLVAVEYAFIRAGETALIKTGLAFELPAGYEMQVRPRSGITLKTHLRVQIGTVDANYRGEVGVIVDNTFHETLCIKKGTRIAQAIIQRLPAVEMIEVDELGGSERGTDGFGSTGVKAEKGGE